MAGGCCCSREDLAEITELADLILVMSQGRIVGSYTPETLDVAELGLLMTGAKGYGSPHSESVAGWSLVCRGGSVAGESRVSARSWPVSLVCRDGVGR